MKFSIYCFLLLLISPASMIIYSNEHKFAESLFSCVNISLRTDPLNQLTEVPGGRFSLSREELSYFGLLQTMSLENPGAVLSFSVKKVFPPVLSIIIGAIKENEKSHFKGNQKLLSYLAKQSGNYLKNKIIPLEKLTKKSF